MTTKKSKKYDLIDKKDFKHRPKETKKKNQNTNKGIDTFFPISNEENTQKIANHSK
jgi:hypothetical protein